MADATQPREYRAFIAYSRRNTEAAERLFWRLEGFRLGKALTGRSTPLGTVPARLKHIFLDRYEFDAGTALAPQTIEALDHAAALIVLASPDAAQSRYVNEEVRLFRDRHKRRRVIPVIVAGAPDDGTDMLFPPALRFALNAEGAVTDQPDEVPLGADERPGADGGDRAFAKIVAGLTGLHMDEVYQRDRRVRRQQIGTWAAVAAVVLALAGTGGLFYWRTHQQQHTIALSQHTLDEIAALVRKYQPITAAQGAVPGGKQSLTAAITAIAEGAATDPRYAQALELLKQGRPADAEPLLRAAADEMANRSQRDAKQAAEAYRNLGAIAGLADPKRALEAYARAVALDPDNIDGLAWAGWLQLASGHLDAAEQSFQHLLALTATRQSREARNDAFGAQLGLGDIEVARGRVGAALTTYQAAANEIQALARQAPDDAEWHRDLSASHDRVGDVQVAQGNLAEASQSYRASLAIPERLAKADPNNAGWQRDLSVSYEKVGDVLVAQGNLAGALTILPRLASRSPSVWRKADPGNAGWQRDLSVAYDKVGDVLVAQGNLAEALQSYRAGLAIAERLAKADPGNAGWQRDLSVSYDRVGDVQVAQGNLAEALQSYRASLAIAERLAKADPSNAGWQRDLSVSYEQGRRRAGGAGQPGRGAAILPRRASRSPSVWRKADPAMPAGSAISRCRTARSATCRWRRATWRRRCSPTAPASRSPSVWRKSDPAMPAGSAISRCRTTRSATCRWRRATWRRRCNPTAPASRSPSVWPRPTRAMPAGSAISRCRTSKVGDVQVAQGNLAEALQSYRAGLAIRERLAKADPDNAGWQRDLSVSYEKVGDVQVAQGDLAGALQSYRASLAIAERLAKADPSNAGWQRDLSVSDDKVGDVLVAQGELAEALQSYRASLAIRERLAKADPNNGGWQRDLSVSDNKVGDVLVAQGNLADALQSFRASLAIRERLAKADPNNAGWQRDLPISLARVADTLLRQGNVTEALPLAQRALALGRSAVARMPDDRRISRDLPYYEDLLRRASTPMGPQPGSEEDLAANVGDRVFFRPGSAMLIPDARATLDRQAAWLAKYPKVHIQIAGNADDHESGTQLAEERSLVLGQERAESVTRYLQAKGIAPSRIVTISYGQDRPTADGHNPQAWAQNRNAITSVR